MCVCVFVYVCALKISVYAEKFTRYYLSDTSCQMTDLLPVVVVHGGAGFVPKERMELSISGVCAAVRTGYAILKGGGSSMDAVVEAVSQMENNPAFNAGNGETQNFIKYFHLLYICMYMNIYMYVCI